MLPLNCRAETVWHKEILCSFIFLFLMFHVKHQGLMKIDGGIRIKFPSKVVADLFLDTSLCLVFHVKQVEAMMLKSYTYNNTNRYVFFNERRLVWVFSMV